MLEHDDRLTPQDSPRERTTLGRDGPTVSRIGLGLAAIGRPAYITASRAADFGHDRSEGAFRERTSQMLDAAYAAGVRYVDVARSYGLAEQFLSQWLAGRGAVDDLVIGSKWGYTYVGGRDLTAPTTGPKQADASRGALEARVDGVPLFSSVQATGMCSNRRPGRRGAKPSQLDGR